MRTFETTVWIDRPPAAVLALLGDYSRLTEVHPLVTQAVSVPPPPGVLERWLITDALVWGPFRFAIRYRADILVRGPDRLETEAYQAPGTTVRNLTTLTPVRGGTRVDERVTLSAPWPLEGYAFGQARSSHQTLLRRWKESLEGGR